jgi:N-methylhydantoinase B
MSVEERELERSGVRLAVMSNRFEAVVRAMRITLARTARSGVLQAGLDFSCCVITRDHELLAWAESLPIHVMSGPDLMARAMCEFYPELRRGDAFLHNSPYHGNGHAADYSILVPVIDEEGIHHFTVMAKGHLADCGNSLPTTYMAGARDVYEEGALIFPCVRIQQDYRDCEDILRACWMRIRVPEQWWGDHLALLGAARTGERRLVELGKELGWAALHEFSREWFDYSERKMISALRQCPSGRVTTRGKHDPIPQVPDAIPLSATVEVRGDEGIVEVDLRDNPDCQPCGLNLSEATARTGAMIGVFNSIDHTVPPNAGSARRIRVLLRENCIVGIPRHPTSCSLGTTNVMDRVVNLVQRAMAQIGEGFGLGEIGLSHPASTAVLSGHNPRDGLPFVNQIFLAWTGGAGGPKADGWLTFSGPGDGGVVGRDSIEIDELRHPIVFYAQHVVPDTEGAGRFRGAPAALLDYGPLGHSIEVMFLSDGSENPPLGAQGGEPGARARQFLQRARGEVEELPLFAHLIMDDGDRLISHSTGGGGYGPPLARHPELVRDDVEQGFVTRTRAREIYGVVIGDDGTVDVEATAAARTAAGSAP